MNRTKSTRGWFARKFFSRKTVIDSAAAAPKAPQLSLEQLCRVGGVSLLHLPPHLAAAKLAIPTRLAATAAFLVENGLFPAFFSTPEGRADQLVAGDTSGVFRVPGQTRMINTLYNYFVEQAQAANGSYRHVEITIRSASLPKNSSYTLHDVASAFKKFLADIPGGILGSTGLFNRLKSLVTPYLPTAHHPKARLHLIDTDLLATALLSIDDPHRQALISAVFGLLSYLKKEAPESDPFSTSNPIVRPDVMSAKALGVIFAPLLLADLTDTIRVDRPSMISNPQSLPNLMSVFQDQGSFDFTDTKLMRAANLAKGIGRLNLAGAIIEMLIVKWEGVVECIRARTPHGRCYLPWPSLPNPVKTLRVRVRSDSAIHLFRKLEQQQQDVERKENSKLEECWEESQPSGSGSGTNTTASRESYFTSLTHQGPQHANIGRPRRVLSRYQNSFSVVQTYFGERV